MSEPFKPFSKVKEDGDFDNLVIDGKVVFQCVGIREGSESGLGRSTAHALSKNLNASHNASIREVLEALEEEYQSFKVDASLVWEDAIKVLRNLKEKFNERTRV
jgi:hypothetical protein